MKHASILFFLLGIVATFQSCTSGKNALKQGDYYQAVSLAVNRLRQNPDHKKSKEVLKTSYQIAVEYLEQNAQNQIIWNKMPKIKLLQTLILNGRMPYKAMSKSILCMSKSEHRQVR